MVILLTCLVLEYAEQGELRQENHNDAEYPSYDRVVGLLKKTAEKYKEIAEIHKLGETKSKRVIYAIKISDNVKKNETCEKEVLFMALHHGNEIVTVPIVMELIRKLTEEYETDPEIKEKVDKHEIWIVPMVNPDGYEKGTRFNANCVDLNRNYDANWGNPKEYKPIDDKIIKKVKEKVKKYFGKDWTNRETKKNLEEYNESTKDDDSKKGTKPFSEKETQAIRTLVEDFEEQGKIDGFSISISWHSFGGKILFPYSYDNFSQDYGRDGDEAIFRSIAEAMKKAMKNKRSESGETGEGYQVSHPWLNGYNVGGDSEDWLYSKGIYAFTIEAYGEEESNVGYKYYPTDAVTLKKVVRNNVAAALALLGEAESATDTTDEKGNSKGKFIEGESAYLVGGVFPELNAIYPIHVVNDTNWSDGMMIPSRIDGTKKRIYTKSRKTIPVGTLIWNYCKSGQYDIVVDINRNGIYDEDKDPLIDNEIGTAGFIVLSNYRNTIQISDDFESPYRDASVSVAVVSPTSLSKIYFEFYCPDTLNFIAIENGGTLTDGFDLWFTAIDNIIHVQITATEASGPLPPTTIEEQTPLCNIILKADSASEESMHLLKLTQAKFFDSEGNLTEIPMLIHGWFRIDINFPPYFDYPGLPDHITVKAGQTLRYRVRVLDPDPLDDVTVNIKNYPVGLSFNITGSVVDLFFTPTFDQIGDHVICIEATDNGHPPLTISSTLTITVTGPSGLIASSFVLV